MSTSLFTITPTPPISVRLEPGEDGTFSFTVTSLAAPDKIHELIFQALLVGVRGNAEEVDWLVVEPPRTLSMTGGKTQTVVLGAHPTTRSPRGEQRIKLAVADVDRPNDAFAYSPPVICDIVAAAVVGRPAHKPLPSWLIPALLGGLLLIGAGILYAVWPRSRTLGQPCDGDKVCNKGLLCAPVAKICLGAGGAACTSAQAGLCASGECASNGVCAIPLDGACSAAAGAPCPRLAVCDPVTNTCQPSKVPTGPPGRPRGDQVYSVDIDGDPVKGRPDALVTIVRVDEYACPFCEKARITLDVIAATYGNDVRFVHKSFIVHPSVVTDAAAVACAANRQGKFWEMDTLLWEKAFKTRQYDMAHLEDLAREAGLDLGRLRADVAGPCPQEVRGQQLSLPRIGVGAVPTFYINGRYLAGAQPFEAFKLVIDEELARARDRVNSGTRREDYYFTWIVKKGLTEVPQ